MAQQLQTVVAAVRALSPRDKLELLQVISRDLQQLHTFGEDSAAFWEPHSIEDVARTRMTPVVTDIAALAMDFWPDDESADDINRFVAEQRRADRT